MNAASAMTARAERHPQAADDRGENTAAMDRRIPLVRDDLSIEFRLPHVQYATTWAIRQPIGVLGRSCAVLLRNFRPDSEHGRGSADAWRHRVTPPRIPKSHRGLAEFHDKGTSSSEGKLLSMANAHDDWVQFGCGLCAPAAWTNFDSSPTLRLEKLPVLGRLVPPGPYGRFPRNVRYGDIVTGLPVKAGAVALLYCSHVLEHLALEDLRVALRNCRRILRPGGTFRLVLPDLEALIKAYAGNSADDAALKFIEHSGLGRTTRPRSTRTLLRDCLGNSHHLWLWDFKSLRRELADAGFVGVRRAHYGDSASEPFSLVEDESRWRDALGIECHAPG